MRHKYWGAPETADGGGESERPYPLPVFIGYATRDAAAAAAVVEALELHAIACCQPAKGSCERDYMNPSVLGLNADKLGKTAESAVASAPNHVASVAAN
jgi:hypothetical protein